MNIFRYIAVVIFFTQLSYATNIYFHRHTLERYKRDFPAYLKEMHSKIQIGAWLPDTVLRLFGGRNASRKELHSLDRFFDRTWDRYFKGAYDDLLCDDEDIRDINEIMTEMHHGATKDDIIAAVHPRNVKRLQLSAGTTRYDLVIQVQDVYRVSHERYFKGMMFSLFIMYLYDKKIIRK